MNTETMIEKLNQAADLIEEKGWCQKQYRNEKGELCLTGALRETFTKSQVWSGNDEHGEASKLLEGRLPNLAQDEFFTPIAQWNDDPNRTKDQVINLLRDTASSLETP